MPDIIFALLTLAQKISALQYDTVNWTHATDCHGDMLQCSNQKCRKSIISTHWWSNTFVFSQNITYLVIGAKTMQPNTKNLTEW